MGPDGPTRVLQAVPGDGLDPRPLAAGGPPHHHPGGRAQGRRLRQQRLRQARARLPGHEGPPRRRAVPRSACTAYMDRWHGKHPIPWDFFNTFNDVSGQDLNWFWRNWYFSTSYIDLAVGGGARRRRAGYTVRVANVGGMAAPFDLRAALRRRQHRDASTRPPPSGRPTRAAPPSPFPPAGRCARSRSTGGSSPTPRPPTTAGPPRSDPRAGGVLRVDIRCCHT